MDTERESTDGALRARIGRLIDAGRLPLQAARRIFGGYGSGIRCAACEEPITSDQVEYELEHGPASMLNMHLTCYSLWQVHCAMRARRHPTEGADSAEPA